MALVVVTVFLLLGGISLGGWVSDANNPAKVAQSKFKEVMDKTGAFGG